MTQSTPTRMTRTITTRTICTSEHSSAPLVCVFVTCHTTLAQVVLESVILMPCRTCVVVLDSLRPLFLLPPALAPSFSFSPSSCTLTCTPTSTTWTPWKITCATPPRGATTPTTSPSPSQKHDRTMTPLVCRDASHAQGA